MARLAKIKMNIENILIIIIIVLIILIIFYWLFSSIKSNVHESFNTTTDTSKKNPLNELYNTFWKNKKTYKKIWNDMVENPDKPYAVMSMNTNPMTIKEKIDQTKPYTMRDFSKYYLYKLNKKSIEELKKISKNPYTGYIVNHNKAKMGPDYLDLS